MIKLTNFPVVLFVLLLAGLWFSAKVGTRFAHRLEDFRDDFNVILGATLTLLGLLIGFTFSMASGRYDQRKLYEEEEANAIGTEYVRLDLLPAPDAEKLRSLLRDYVNQRILFYETRDHNHLQEINAKTSLLQQKLWAGVRDAALAKQTPVITLAVSGMNDVLNSQGYTQAAWWNRIPSTAWALLVLIAISSNLMVGAQWRAVRTRGILIFILPALISVSLFLIADIDAPRRGLIQVYPINLMSLAQSLH